MIISLEQHTLESFIPPVQQQLLSVSSHVQRRMSAKHVTRSGGTEAENAKPKMSVTAFTSDRHGAPILETPSVTVK